MARRYEMSTRITAMQQTREAILDAAVELFEPAWFDEVTVADVARRAGVSQQTVVNHFGSKLGLYLAGVSERISPTILEHRSRAVPGDVASIVATAVSGYERTGDATVRLLALAGRVPELAEIAAGGRAAHRAWVEEVFAPELARRRGARRDRTVVLLAAALDVGVWKGLRRDEGLDVEEACAHLRALVDGVLAG